MTEPSGDLTMTSGADVASWSDVAGSSKRPRLSGRRLSPFNVASGVIAVVLAAAAVYPLVRVLTRLVWDDGAFDISPITQTFTQRTVWRSVLHTVIVVAISGALAMVIGSCLAWLNERTDARLGVVTDMLPMANLLLPGIAGAVGWLLLLSPRAGYLNWIVRGALRPFGIDLSEGPFSAHTWYAVIAVYVINLVPFVFLVVSAGLRNLDSTLEEQSRMCGAGLPRTVARVTLPAMRPSLGGAAFLVVWVGFGMLSVPLILARPAGIDMISVRIVRSLRFTFPPDTGTAVGLGAFVMVALGLCWYAQRRVLRVQRHGTVGGKGTTPVRVRLGRWRWPARIVILGYLFVAVVLPIAALLLVALNGFWTTRISWGNLGFEHIRNTIANDRFAAKALSNSLRLAAIGATVGMVAAAIVALWIRRSRRRATQILDAAIKFPATVSSTVIAVGIVLAFAGPPFGMAGSLGILLLAYIVLSMPEASVLAEAALAQVGGELPEASSTSGAPPGRTFRRVYLPLMLPGLTAGWALLFVRLVGDVNASSILASASNTVVGFRILEVYENGSYAAMATLSLVLTAISTAVLVVVLGISRRWTRWSRLRATDLGAVTAQQ